MPDDWSWFFAGEAGRTNLLRDELEGLQASASASSAQSARLSSQLRTLQGSIESRLQALSTAFDAYVELGDVREQLDGYPETGAVRREAARALATLAQGGVPDHVEARGQDYWLVAATNEVVDLVADPSAGPVTTAGPGAQEHETFVVAALGWLGLGDRVTARVAPLLVGDGALAAPQVVLWHAAAHGVFGDVLPTVREAWRPDLDLTASTWDRFTRDAADAADAAGTLRWTSELLAGRWSPTPTNAPPADDRAALRSLVDALVGAGLGDERALLERARVLRARIEDPGAAEPDRDGEPPRTAITQLVQEALLDPTVGSAARRALVGWVHGGLAAAAGTVAGRAATEQPAPVVVHTELGDLDVGPEGADPARLAQLDSLAEQRWAIPRSRLLVPAVVGGVTLLAGLVLLATQRAGLGVFLIVIAVAAGVLGVRALLRARRSRSELAATRENTRRRVEEGRTTARAVRTASLTSKAEVTALARAITEAADPAVLR